MPRPRCIHRRLGHPRCIHRTPWAPSTCIWDASPSTCTQTPRAPLMHTQMPRAPSMCTRDTSPSTCMQTPRAPLMCTQDTSGTLDVHTYALGTLDAYAGRLGHPQHVYGMPCPRCVHRHLGHPRHRWAPLMCTCTLCQHTPSMHAHRLCQCARCVDLHQPPLRCTCICCSTHLNTLCRCTHGG
jgi:hypothetical protein